MRTAADLLSEVCFFQKSDVRSVWVLLAVLKLYAFLSFEGLLLNVNVMLIVRLDLC